MKHLLPLLAVLILFSCTNEPKKVEVKLPLTKVVLKDSASGYTSEDIEFLRQMGMTSSMTFRENVKLADAAIYDKYMKKYGLRAMSDEALDVFLRDHGLILGVLSDYKYTIPPIPLRQFKANLARVGGREDFYFARVSRTADREPGRFLTKIRIEDIQPHWFDKIESGPTMINGQLAEATGNVLSGLMYRDLALKYNVPRSEIVVDHYSGNAIHIIAQKEYFDLEGKEIINNKIVPKDPAIIMRVEDGWLILAVW